MKMRFKENILSTITDVKSIFSTFRMSFFNIVVFELVFKVIVMLVFSPIIQIIFEFAMGLNGIVPTIGKVLLLITLAVVATALIYFELAVLLICINATRSGVSIKLLDAIKNGFKSLGNLLHWSTIGLSIYLIVLLPLLKIGIQSSLIPGVDIPEFITGEISKYSIGWIAIDLFTYAPIAIFIILPYVLPIMILENENFLHAFQRNFQYTKKNRIHIVIDMGIIILISYALIQILNYSTTSDFPLIYSGGGLAIDIIQILTTPVMLTALLVRFPREQHVDSQPSSVGQRKIPKSIVAIVVLALFVISYINTNNYYTLKDESYIIGHRGSLQGVENTVPAIMGAAEEKADFAEIDVMLSKDNIPVVIHDSNLFRLTGKLGNVGDYTAKELSNMDQKQDGMVEKIQTLKEICAASKDKIRLLVELKSHGKEAVDVVDTIIDVLKEKGVYDQCIFQTSDEKMINKMDDEYPEAKVGLVVVISLSDLPDKTIEDTPAEFLSVEDSVFEDELIDICHNNNKDIYVWTVNSEDTIKSLLRAGVDGIITDYPEKSRKTMEEMM